ncbi:ATP-grasp domain-containing protein [Gillisia sp. Hel_I_86]|uniref:ATP-grasp domain-containing protein n=1 Tax=Gillisia sp. Hel_I_86 TaxID=1249981 RepID=UPI0011AAC815|nr:ATP-grasp domain-containing protein [Gillisia sp. Hel_I_86]
MTEKKKIAILFQAQKPPIQGGIQKPMKPGGYSDSGADIAFSLKNINLAIITPVENPNLKNDYDWVFPDTENGIQSALDKGATIFWLNTILYKNHPIETFFDGKIEIVGQCPKDVDLFDDKWRTNQLLKEQNLPIPRAKIFSKKNLKNNKFDFPFPIVTKPIRGRGSQGVYVAQNQKELFQLINELIDSNKYGKEVYIEEYLSGQEITITVMPPGKYIFHNKEKRIHSYWSLPAIKRFNHHNGIAPYNGTVAVIENSSILNDAELQQDEIKIISKHCEKAAKIIKAKAPIRIDCRANDQGDYFIFDLNMKPNMTGSSRPHRKDQDSLSSLAARKIGWNYEDLLINILEQKWTAPAANIV